MAKKDINIFSVAFIDLLSGALAAVIILFIVVPKMTTDAQGASEKLAELNIQAHQLDSIVSNLANSVPREELKNLERMINEMQQTIDDLGYKVRDLEDENNKLTSENNQFKEELATSQEQLTTAQNQLEQLQNENEELKRQLEESQQSQGSGPGEVLFGTNADFAIYYSWDEDADFDLHLVNLDLNEVCYYHNPVTSFARLMGDMQTSTSDSYELIYMQEGELKQGRYLLKVNVFSEGEKGVVNNPRGTLVIFPNKPNEIKMELPTKRFSNNMGIVNVLEFTLSNNNIQITRTY